MNKRTAFIFSLSLSLPVASLADTVGYGLAAQESLTAPGFQYGNYVVTNQSSTQCGVHITYFSMEIGGDWQWDWNDANSGAAVLGSKTDLGTNNDGVVAQLYEVNYSAFAEGDFHDSSLDIDGRSLTRDFSAPHFDNGADPNTVVTVRFSNGQELTTTLSDGLSPTASDFAIAQSTDAADGDSDGDGQSDGVEQAAGSNPCVAEIVIGDTNTGVADRDLGGVSLGEVIAQESALCKARAVKKGKYVHGKYVSCVAKALNELRDEGDITEAERGALQSAAAQNR